MVNVLLRLLILLLMAESLITFLRKPSRCVAGETFPAICKYSEKSSPLQVIAKLTLIH
jgi:hypothetical protein